MLGEYSGALTYLSCAAANLGDLETADKADSLLTLWAIQNDRVSSPRYLYKLSKIAAASGRRDEALELLDEVIEALDFFLLETPEGDHWFHFRLFEDDPYYKLLFQAR